MRYSIICLLLLCCGTGCIKEGTIKYTTLHINSSSHQVKVYGYDTLFHPDTPHLIYELSPGGKRQTESIGAEIKSSDNKPDYSSRHNNDSLLVVFDNSDTILHYNNNSLSSPNPYYPKSSLRNLYNTNSYQETITEGKRNFKYKTYTYTFTDADYEDARR